MATIISPQGLDKYFSPYDESVIVLKFPYVVGYKHHPTNLPPNNTIIYLKAIKQNILDIILLKNKGL